MNFLARLQAADPDLAMKLFVAAILLGAGALVFARLLKTSSVTSLPAQARAASIASLLLLIYAVGECIVEGPGRATLVALSLPVALLGLSGLAKVWTEDLARDAAAAALAGSGADDGVIADPKETGTSENRRAA